MKAAVKMILMIMTIITMTMAEEILEMTFSVKLLYISSFNANRLKRILIVVTERFFGLFFKILEIGVGLCGLSSPLASFEVVAHGGHFRKVVPG